VLLAYKNLLEERINNPLMDNILPTSEEIAAVLEGKITHARVRQILDEIAERVGREIGIELPVDRHRGLSSKGRY